MVEVKELVLEMEKRGSVVGAARGQGSERRGSAVGELREIQVLEVLAEEVKHLMESVLIKCYV